MQENNCNCSILYSAVVVAVTNFRKLQACPHKKIVYHSERGKKHSILCGSSFEKSDSETVDLQVLEKIIKLDLPSDYVFNVFYAFTTKYIPRETRQGSQIYDLFRLIVQYHDPQLKYVILC